MQAAHASLQLQLLSSLLGQLHLQVLVQGIAQRQPLGDTLVGLLQLRVQLPEVRRVVALRLELCADGLGAALADVLRVDGLDDIDADEAVGRLGLAQA